MITSQSDMLEWYIQNQAELIDKYAGQHLVINAEGVVAAFDSAVEAYQYAMEHLEPGSFILQRCSQGTDDYTARFYSPLVA